ncbi:MAG TPA: tyrosine-type recombinase/integrase [Fimbriimonas sp.]|nr:tyrosine-type recombinase/integrase [Fimbriimonas sp.]
MIRLLSMSNQAARNRKPRSEGLTAKGEHILYLRPQADAWPEASERAARPGTFEAKGVDASGKRKSYYGKTAYEASYKAAESLGLLEVADDLSLHAFYCRSYWPSVAARSYNWREQIRWAYDNYIGPKWGGVDMPAIKKREVQEWFNSLIGKLEASSLHKIKIVFSGIINLALDELVDDDDNSLIRRNPLARIKLPAKAEPDKIALTAGQLRALIDAASGREVPAILLCSIGLRKSEACAVQRDRIKTSVLEVNQQIAYEKGKGFFMTTVLKTPQSKRRIPLPTGFEAMLLGADQVSDVFVCSDSLGGFLTPKNLDRELAAAVKRAGVPSISAHELRHTFISILENELEAPDTIVSMLAGRSKRSSNSAYSHSTMQQLQRWMNAYWELISKAEPECLQECTTAVVVQNA